jgi:hypothetical protein
MNTLATRPPARQPGLVTSPADNGRYLLRNRRTGESFHLGEQEHFLLVRLDGRLSGDEISRAFAERFGEPLGEDELDEFVALSAERGLLQGGRIDNPSYGADDDGIIDPGPLEQAAGTPASASSNPAWRARWTIRLLKAIATALQWLVWLPNLVGRRIQEKIRELQFVPRPDDVFIVTYPRSGTTWMQMILYQLTTDGNMDFPHIAEYCPWFEKSLRAATAFETRPSPRLFKTHLPYRKVPKGPCKYIYVARNGRDVAVSYYHLYRTYNSFEGGFEQFFNLFVQGKTAFGCWYEHVEGWWAHRDDANVLFLTYEELKHDLESSLRRIAAFIGRDVPQERMPRVVERCGFAFMKQYEDKFDPAMESLWEQGVKLKSFLRQGRVGDGDVSLNEEQKAKFESAFRDRLEKLGVSLA